MKPPRESEAFSIWLNCRLADLPPRIAAGIEERRKVLDIFAHEPRNTQTWEMVVAQALKEEQRRDEQPEELAIISAEDLSSFARKIIAARSEDRYTLTTTKAPNGELWFDVLYGFYSKSGEWAIEAALESIITKSGRPKVTTLVDLGTGTGNTIAAVSRFAERAIGVDRNRPLIEVARQKHPKIEFEVADVTGLPLESNSADVVTSNGLKYSLDAANATAMYREIARILKPDGVYIDAELLPAKDIVLSKGTDGKIIRPDFHPEDLGEFMTWRAVLQDMIVDTTSGKFKKNDSLPLKGSEWQAFIGSIGLSEYHLRAHGERIMARARVLQKISSQ